MTIKNLLFKSVGLGINAFSFLSTKKAGELAFALFAKPPKATIRPKEKQFLDQAERLDISWNGLNVPVYRWGTSGPTVFCAYGWGYNAGRWRHYAPGLVEAGYRVVAFDPPGHGQADYGYLDYPKYVDIEERILRKVGGCQLVLSHSFGGGCLVEALKNLPPEMRPERAVVMGVFSEVRWIFTVFANSLGLRKFVFDAMADYIAQRTGRTIDEFDVAVNGSQIPDVEFLVVHDPADKVVSIRNARRNHSHWVGSHLYTPSSGGHHLGTAEITNNVLQFLTTGELPPNTTTNVGDIDPLPSIISEHDLVSSGGVSDYYN